MSAPAGAGASSTVFVRNLPYSWGDRDLERCFEHVGPIKRAFVVTTRGAKRGASAVLSEDGGVAAPDAAGSSGGESRGFGFIEFSLPADALRATEEMNGKDVGGAEEDAAKGKGKGGKKPLAVELSMKKGEKPAAAAAPKKAAGAAAAPAAATATPAAAAAAAAPAAAAAKPEPAAPKAKKGLAVKDLKLDAAAVRKAQSKKQESDSETDEEGDEPAPKKQKAEAKTAAAPAAKPAAATAKPGKPASAPTPSPSAAPSTSSSSTSSSSSRTLLLSGINPTVKNLRDHLKGLSDSLETVLYPSPESTAKYKAARLTFASDVLAAQAAKLLDKKLIKGDPVRAILLANELKANRLIIRNLPWLVGEKRLHQIFKDCCKPVAEGGGGGSIASIELPKGPDGKSKGFGFISFTSARAAELSLSKTGTILNNRPIAVDWVLAKDDYVNRQTVESVEEEKARRKREEKEARAEKEKAEQEKKAKQQKAKADASKVKDEDGDVVVKEEEADLEADMLNVAKDKLKNRSVLDSILGKDDDEDEEDALAAKKRNAKKDAAKPTASVKKEEAESDEEDEDKDASMAGSDDDEDDSEDGSEGDAEDDSDDDDDEDEDEDDDDDAINMTDDDDSDAEDGSDEESDDSAADSDEEEASKEDTPTEEDDAAAKRARALASKPSDTLKGCTIFIRNLAYDTKERDLLEKFAQFGEVKYGKVVWDRELDRSRGTAFVQFADPAVAAKVVGMSVDSSTNPAALYKKNRITAAVKAGSGITLGGRVLNIALAVDRNSAASLEEKNKAKQKEDKRNLYLANEGNIRADSAAASGISPAELAKREKSFREKKKKLKNPNYAVSRTRLSVRNLPLDVDEKILKKVFLKAARDAIKEQPRDSPLRDGTIGQPVVRQVKLLRSEDRLDAKGVGRSKRYGFLEFEHHEHSLLALRRLNNNPEAFATVEGPQGAAKHTRPFVEFALEDVRKLLVRQQKLAAALKRKALKEKQQAELEQLEGAKGEAAAKAKPLKKSSEQPRKKPLKPVADASAGGGRGACFTCGQGGHISKNCPSNPEKKEGEAPKVAAATAAAKPVAGGKRKASDVAEGAAGKKAKGAAAAPAAAPPAASAAPPAKRNKNNRHRDIAVPKHLRDGEDEEARFDALANKYKHKMAGGDAARNKAAGANAAKAPPALRLAKESIAAAASRWID